MNRDPTISQWVAHLADGLSIMAGSHSAARLMRDEARWAGLTVDLSYDYASGLWQLDPVDPDTAQALLDRDERERASRLAATESDRWRV